MEKNTESAQAEEAVTETPKGFAGWGNAVEDQTENTQPPAVEKEEQKATETSKTENKNQIDEDDFNEKDFLTDYKTKNPNATEEEIQEKLKAAEKDFYTISGDLFESKEEAKGTGKNNLSEQLKAIIGDDYDDIKHSSINNIEDFNNTIKETVDKRVNKMVAKQDRESEFVKNMNPIDKSVFNILETKGLSGLRDLLTPNTKLNQFRAMDDESLVINGLKNTKGADGKPLYTDEEIEQKVGSKSVEDIALDAKGIRSSLDRMEAENLREVSEMINNDAAQRRNQEAIQKDTMASKMEQVLNKLSDFHGLELTDDLSKSLTDNYRQGKFDYLMKDPNFLVKAILFDKIGDRAFRRYGKLQFEKGREKFNQQEHNVDGLSDNSFGGGQGSQGSTGFAGW